MLKTRLIPCIITRGDRVVQSFGFNKYLPIGDIKTAIEFFVKWDVDEIIILDITATKEKRTPNLDLIEWAASECFVPLTVGGGITNINDIRRLINAGADKVCLNTLARISPNFVTEASSLFGSQCITVSVDAKKIGDSYFLYNHLQNKEEKIKVIDYVKKLEFLGAGEIFLNSVDRDGSRAGYDTKLLKLVSSKVRIPVIACGGVGTSSHLPLGVIEGGCQAVSASNIFQHTEHSTIAAKSMLLKHGVEVRLSGKVKYDQFKFDKMGRPF